MCEHGEHGYQRKDEPGYDCSPGDPLPSVQVILMVGLPGSGKSHWARTHIEENPEREYTLLGTEELLACMIVSPASGFKYMGKKKKQK